MSKLFKHSFKSLLSSKFFSFTIIFIVFISGLLYTVLESTSSGFASSYNDVTKNGSLHDFVIKEKFLFSKDSQYKIQIENQDDQELLKDPLTIYQGIQDSSIKQLWKLANKEIKNDSLIVNLDFKVVDAKKDYQSIGFKNPLIQKWNFIKSYDNKLMNADKEKLFFKDMKAHLMDKKTFFEDNAKEYQTQLFIKGLKSIYKNQIAITNTRSISINNNENGFNVVEFNPAADVNKMIVYDGVDKLTKVQNDQEMANEIYFQAKKYFGENGSYTINSSKGFKWSAQNHIGSVVTITDPSSYQAIVSPSYANNNNKKAITPEQAIEIWKSGDLEKITSDLALFQKYEKNIIMVDKIPFLILGIGTKPDYVFPIIDKTRPNPNVKNEAIVFVNRRGYQRIQDSFRTNHQENYISVKILSQKSIPNFQNEVKKISQTGLAPLWSDYKGYIPISNWPDNVSIITEYNNLNDGSLLVQERVIFLEKLQSTISTVSNVSTSFLIIFVLSIVALTFGFVIKQKRKILATLLALGYTKIQITFSLSLVAIILGALPSLLSYFLGFFIQNIFIQIFDSYWTIPIYTENFSLISLLIVAIIPFFFIFITIFITTLLIFNETIPNMIKEYDNRISLIPKIVNIFSFLPIKIKYAISLSLKNILSILVITLAAISSTTAMMVSFSSQNKASMALTNTKKHSNYEFKINLYSPTIEGGNYNLIEKDDGEYYVKSSEEEKQIPTFDVTYGANKKVNLKKPHWHVPSINDSKYTFKAEDNLDQLEKIAYYLKNKIQTQALLDVPIAGFKTWNIAKKLMPDNQVNNSIEYYEKFLKKYPNKNVNINQRIKDFREYISQNNKQYLITYKNIIIDKMDETYTYLDFKLNNKKDDKDYQIIGLKENTKYVNLKSGLIAKMRNIKNPLVVGKFIKEKYNYQIGDKIKIKIKNKLQRNLKNFKNPLEEFTIVDFADTYQDNEFYTLKSTADKIIGFKSTSNNTSNFNGIFTHDKNSPILNNVSLYSPSGIYIATDHFGGKWETILNKILQSPSLWKYGSTIAQNSYDFKNIYSATPYVTIFNDVSWKKINNYTFENISNLSYDIMFMAEITSITLSILFSIIISSLVISGNKKRIAILWAMGYRKSEIIKTFASIYTIPIIISIALSIPLSIITLSIIKNFIMSFGAILIPLSISWTIIFAPIINIFIFIFSILISTQWLEPNKAIKIFKE